MAMSTGGSESLVDALALAEPGFPSAAPRLPDAAHARTRAVARATARVLASRVHPRVCIALMRAAGAAQQCVR